MDAEKVKKEFLPQTGGEEIKEKIKMTHKFVESQSKEKYERVIFCEKCGKVAWHYNWSQVKNIAELQSRVGRCIDVEISEPPQPPQDTQ